MSWLVCAWPWSRSQPLVWSVTAENRFCPQRERLTQSHATANTTRLAALKSACFPFFMTFPFTPSRLNKQGDNSDSLVNLARQIIRPFPIGQPIGFTSEYSKFGLIVVAVN